MKQVVLITGGSQGIGAATCRLAARQGYVVAFSYRSNPGQAEALAAEINAAGGEAHAFRADAANEADTIALFQSIDALGRLVGLVNNAGITGPACTLEQVTAEMLDEVMAINVKGIFLATREAIPRMANDRGGEGGAIVNVSSRAAALGGGGTWVHYAASKGAVDSFTIGASNELVGRGIRVNAVNPGLIITDIHAKAGLGERIQTMAPTVPMRRAGTADEVAEAIVWLLSPASSYVTGALLPVGGGR
jgi:short-subunit dehydrogenase